MSGKVLDLELLSTMFSTNQIAEFMTVFYLKNELRYKTNVLYVSNKPVALSLNCTMDPSKQSILSNHCCLFVLYLFDWSVQYFLVVVDKFYLDFFIKLHYFNI